MVALMLWAAKNFTDLPQLWTTKLLMLAWSISDLVLIFALLRIAGLARARAGRRPIRGRYAALGLTALLVPVLGFAPSTLDIFYLESSITIPQFLILIYSLFVERSTLLPMVEERIRRAVTPPNRP